MEPYGYHFGYHHHQHQHHHQAFTESGRHDSGAWIVDPFVASNPANQVPALPSQFASPAPWAMDRYLHDNDRTLFVPRPPNEHSFCYPFHEARPYPDAAPYAYSGAKRMSSPSISGPSSHSGSGWSDRHSTPWSSPGPSGPAYSPELTYNDLSYGGAGHCVHETNARPIGGPCVGVALHDVQNYADELPERDLFDEEHGAYYASYAQEGYHQMDDMHSNGEQPPSLSPSGADTPSTGEYALAAPNIRHRKRGGTRAMASPVRASKVSKQPSTHRRSSSSCKSKAEAIDYNVNGNSKQMFLCPFVIYGCQSNFGSKNEWKRHVNTQHMRLGYWRCDQCDQSERKPNDFNRKDLFIQHVRRMHPLGKTKSTKASKTTIPKAAKNDPDEQELTAIANRCFKRLRNSPDHSCCLFCENQFTGAGTWDDRLEHIGRHMETRKKENSDPVDPTEWQTDSGLEAWLAHEQIIVESGKGWILADGQV